MSSPSLSGRQRRFLRSLAHALEPVVQIGRQGTTPAVLAQVDAALSAHELVKIRLGQECPDSLAVAGAAIEDVTRAAVVDRIGRTLIVFRARPKRPTLVLPDTEAPRAAAPGATKARPRQGGAPARTRPKRPGRPRARSPRKRARDRR